MAVTVQLETASRRTVFKRLLVSFNRLAN